MERSAEGLATSVQAIGQCRVGRRPDGANGNNATKLPAERVGSMSAWLFHDPLEAKETTPNASPAAVIAIADWLGTGALNVICIESAAAGCNNPIQAPQRPDGIRAIRDASQTPAGAASAANKESSKS